MTKLTKPTIVDGLYECTDVNPTIIIKNLVYFLYDCTYCVGGMFENVIYKELPNVWSYREIDTFTDEEKKYECTCDKVNGCTVDGLINKKVETTGENFVTLVAAFDDIATRIDDDFYAHAINKNFIIREYVESFPKRMKEVFYDGTVIVRNASNICNAIDSAYDHYGSDHCLIKLETDETVQFEKPTLEEFIEMLYSIKYKKFNMEYESIRECEVKINKNEKLIEIMVEFDYYEE